MARPRKEGLDYFSHDTDAVNDEKIELLRSLYKNDGYAFYFIMLERIYRNAKFEIDVSDAETREEMFQILSKKVGVELELFKKMLNTAMKYGCFDKELYEKKGIITSAGIKKRAETVTDKRAKMQERYKKSKIVSGEVSAEETQEETEAETPQSKEKQSKEKQSKATTITDLYKLYTNSGFGNLNDIVAQEIAADVEKYGVEKVEEAVKITALRNRHDWFYVRGVLRGGKKNEPGGNDKKDSGEIKGKYAGYKPPKPDLTGFEYNPADIM